MLTSRRPSTRLATASLLFGILLALHASYYLPFLSDDALISLRYARRFLQGEGLTWTDGQPVEGYSNLLWILAIASLGASGVDLITAARILGMIGMGAVILSVLWTYGDATTLRHPSISPAAGLLFFCLAAPTAVWAIGGLEQSLLAALLGIAIAASFSVVESPGLRLRPTLLASLSLGLMCLTRPDGPLFTLAVVSTLVLLRRLSYPRPPLRGAFVVCVFPVLFYAGQIAFRLAYYGRALPNTALVKLTPSLHHLIGGIKYVGFGMIALGPFSFLAVLSLILSVRSGRARPRALLLLVMTLFWLSYVVVIGGDIFPAFRHFVPVVVFFTFAIVEGTDLAWSDLKDRRIRGLPGARYGAIALFAVYLLLQFTMPRNRWAVFERWEWDGKVVGLLMKRAFAAEQPLLAVTAAGCLPYWSELPALDMLGLNDDYLSRHPPPDLGQGPLGHELGDARYVLGRAPDIIAFRAGERRGSFRGDQELQQMKGFNDHYPPVVVRGAVPDGRLATLWIRKDSAKIGIRRTPDEIRVPGFLLNAYSGAVAYLDRNDKLVVAIVSGRPAGVDLQGAASTAWRCQVRASARSGIGCKAERLASDAVRITVSTTSPDPVEIEELVLRAPASAGA